MKSLFSGALLPIGMAVCGAALAQTAPTAGSLTQQIERERPLATARVAPDIRVEQAGAPAMPATAGQKIVVKALRITGAQLFSEAQLLAVTGWRGETALTLAELRAMASTMSAFYRKNGYFLAQAYLPAQDIRDGVVSFAVLEGRYGDVSLRNQSAVDDDVAKKLLVGLARGDAVAIGPLESRVLLLGDLPGVIVKSTLVPGASVGASDLIVDLLPGPRVSGSIDADNQGNRYTGANRLGASLQINNPSGAGDVISVRALTSAADMHYGRLAYQRPLGRATAGLAYSRMDYRLGQDFASLQASGVATIASLYGSYPLLRSRTSNLTAQLHLDDKRFRDRADAAGTRTDKDARVAIASLNGEARDEGGATSYTLSWNRGIVDIASAAARAADAATVRTDGRYNKLSLSATHLQQLSDSVALYGAVNGQVASKNLDAAEKMGLGGTGGVRAYPSGEAYGDQGYVLNLEARALLPVVAGVPGRLTVIGFVDHGSVMANKQPWTSGNNRRSLSGAGLGLTWAAFGRLALSASIASKLGNSPATSAPDTGRRIWVQAVTYF
ncbi:ShlB/FhaC/HecB family hemolysin secretion/activation protein [Massilia sp. DWR3-1-1]|uniref:ShlB/FhaC/HecB family hemolysin secretion/activation protein n=1 Tax=Massilia sp. DWR3-1-1 TaxID=2804559 RepID=UPI003CEA7653